MHIFFPKHEEVQRPDWRAWCMLLLLLLAAAGLRFWGLRDTGIHNVDEGRYLLDGYSEYTELRFCESFLEAKAAERRGGPEFLLAKALPEMSAALKRHAPFLPKVLFSYAIAGVMLAAGGFRVWAGQAVEAVCGVILVGLTWELARRLARPRAALVAAGVMTFLCYPIYFSRTAHPQSMSAMFFLLSILAHLAWTRRREEGRPVYRLALWSGMAAGLAFVSNFQVGGALPALALIHTLACLSPGSSDGDARGPSRLASFLVGGLALAAGFLFVLILTEASSYPLLILFHSQGLAYPHQTFFELLLPRLTHHTEVPFNLSGLVLLPFFLQVFEGYAGAGALAAVLLIGVLAGAAGGWGLAARGGGRTLYRRIVYLGAAFLAPWLMFSVKTLQGARTFVYVLPFLAGLLGLAVSVAWDWPGAARRPVRVVVGVLLCVAGVSSGLHLAELYRIRSCYPEVMQYLAQQPEGPLAEAGWNSILQCYQLSTNQTPEQIAARTGRPAPTRFYLADWQELYYDRYPDNPATLPPGAVVAATFQHSFGRLFLEAELLPAYGATLDNIRWVRQVDLEHARKFMVYRLPEAAATSSSAQ